MRVIQNLTEDREPTSPLTGLEKVMLSTAQKNKWEGNWLGYWFYAKIGFPDPEGSNEEKFLLASDN